MLFVVSCFCLMVVVCCSMFGVCVVCCAIRC